MKSGMFSDALDPLQHPQHGLVGAAVQRPVERGDARRHGGVRVDLRGADRADRGGRAVLLVIGVEDEEDVERALQPGVRLVLELGHLVEHRQEVAGVAQVVVRIDVRLPRVVAEREGGQRRHLGDQADDLDVAARRVLDPRGVGIERGEGADRRQQHAHGVGVVAEPLHEVLDVLVHERVDRDLVRPLVELLLVRQLAVDEEVGDLEVGRLLGELLDRVAAVLQDPGVAVEEGDGRPARRRVHERGVVGHQAEVVVVDLDVAQGRRADRPVLDRHLVGAPGPVVGDGQRVGGGGHSAAVRALVLGRHGLHHGSRTAARSRLRR